MSCPSRLACRSKYTPLKLITVFLDQSLLQLEIYESVLFHVTMVDTQLPHFLAFRAATRPSSDSVSSLLHHTVTVFV